MDRRQVVVFKQFLFHACASGIRPETALCSHMGPGNVGLAQQMQRAHGSLRAAGRQATDEALSCLSGQERQHSLD